MSPTEKTILYGLAAVGAVFVAAAALSPFASLTVTSPLLKGVDIYKIRGSELLGMVFGKKSPEKSGQGINVPIQIEFRMFDPTGSFIGDVLR